MSTTEEQIVQPAVEPAVPAAPAPPTAPAAAEPAKPADPANRRDVLAQAFNTPKTERGKHAAFQPRDQGKFAGAPQFPKPDAVSRPPRPASFKKEIEPHWNTAPVELLQEIIRRDEDYTKGVTPLKEKAQQADDLLKEFEPYRDMLQREGGTPKTAINTLLRAAYIVRAGTPLEKATMIATTMRQFGIPLDHIQQVLGATAQANPQSAPQALDPQFNALAQQVQQLTQTFTARQQQEQDQNEARALQTITKFAEDPAHPHYEAVQEKMYGLLRSPQVMKDVLGVDTSAMDYGQKLQAAYDAAIRLDPALHAQVVAAQQAASQTVQVQKSKAAAVQVKGAPSTGPAPAIDPRDRRAFIAAQLRRAQ